MKKILKSLMYFSVVGLALTLGGCSDDDEDNREAVAGAYSVDVDVTVAGNPLPSIPATVNISKEGDDNLKATANVTLPAGVPMLGGQTITIDLVLSSLKSANEAGATIFMFKIAKQPITVGEMGNIDFQGTNEYNGYDGVVSKVSLAGVSYNGLEFAIKGAIPMVGDEIVIEVASNVEMN